MICSIQTLPACVLYNPMKLRLFTVGFCAVAWLASGQPTCFSGSLCFNTNPTRAFGNARLTPLTSSAPNLVEGREFAQPQAVALDTTTSPPIVYVADNGNNRVLAWKNSASFNNGDKADLVIGQKDMYSTNAQTPGTFSSGLNSPVAVIVDSSGNLYVADAGNNRIVRYPQPFSQTDVPSANQAIGQFSLSTSQGANRGQTAPDVNTLYLQANANTASYPVGMAFDGDGNLWVTDGGNNRVLRYNHLMLAAGGDIGADLVLGQTTMQSRAAPTGADATPYNKLTTVAPLGLAVSAAGDVYVSDSYKRVLYYKAPIVTFGQPAARILGVILPTTDNKNPPALNGCPSSGTAGCDTKLGSPAIPPQGLTAIGNNLYVADSGNSRVVKYDTPDKWQPECPYVAGVLQTCSAGTAFSPIPIAYIGQPSGLDVKPNRGNRMPNETTLYSPVGLANANSDLWVADAGNNRVVVFPGAGQSAGRVLGQYDFTMSTVNLIEGREVNLYGFVPVGSANLLVTGGAVIDPGTAHLYIADTLNHRVLGFSDFRQVRAGAQADIVIGQADFRHAVANYTSTTQDTASTPSNSSLSFPTSVAVDSGGNLWVVDFGNGRVLRFPNPFGQSAPIQANLVLGKATFTTRAGDQSDANRSTTRLPYGIAFTQDGSVLVTDLSLNRILVFRKPSGGDFQNGQSADQVIGQPDFVSSSSGNDLAHFNGPRGLALDNNDRVYVADTGNSRMLVFRSVSELNPGDNANIAVPISSVMSVAVSPHSLEIWAMNYGGNEATRYPPYSTLVLDTSQKLSRIPAANPFAVTLDPFDNPVVGDAYNRITFYYPKAIAQNSGSFADTDTSYLTPGMLALLYRYAPAAFSSQLVVAGSLPLQKSLADIQVTVNGVTAPIWRVMPDRVDFQVPYGAPTSGTAEFVISRVSTGEVLAAANLAMNVAAPSFYTANQRGTGTVAAYNQKASDGSYYGVNSSSNPVVVGDYVVIFGTGMGPVPGAPDDGAAAAGPVPAPTNPDVIVNAQHVTPGYFGLAPTLVGVFQMNVQIPQGTPPGNTVPVGFYYRDIPSTIGPGGKVLNPVTSIAVKTP